LNRMGIYAELRVPELWRYDGRRLAIYELQADGEYRPREASISFRGLLPADVERFIELGRTTAKLRWARAIREWVRTELIPRRKMSELRGTGGSDAS
jgi:hypothetical protein